MRIQAHEAVADATSTCTTIFIFNGGHGCRSDVGSAGTMAWACPSPNPMSGECLCADCGSMLTPFFLGDTKIRRYNENMGKVDEASRIIYARESKTWPQGISLPVVGFFRTHAHML